MPREGSVGTYDPLKKPAEIKLDAERIKYWMGLVHSQRHGAQLSPFAEDRLALSPFLKFVRSRLHRGRHPRDLMKELVEAIAGPSWIIRERRGEVC